MHTAIMKVSSLSSTPNVHIIGTCPFSILLEGEESPPSQADSSPSLSFDTRSSAFSEGSVLIPDDLAIFPGNIENRAGLKFSLDDETDCELEDSLISLLDNLWPFITPSCDVTQQAEDRFSKNDSESSLKFTFESYFPLPHRVIDFNINEYESFNTKTCHIHDSVWSGVFTRLALPPLPIRDFIFPHSLMYLPIDVSTTNTNTNTNINVEANSMTTILPLESASYSNNSSGDNNNPKNMFPNTTWVHSSSHNLTSIPSTVTGSSAASSPLSSQPLSSQSLSSQSLSSQSLSSWLSDDDVSDTLVFIRKGNSVYIRKDVSGVERLCGSHTNTSDTLRFIQLYADNNANATFGNNSNGRIQVFDDDGDDIDNGENNNDRSTVTVMATGCESLTRRRSRKRKRNTQTQTQKQTKRDLRPFVYEKREDILMNIIDCKESELNDVLINMKCHCHVSAAMREIIDSIETSASMMMRCETQGGAVHSYSHSHSHSDIHMEILSSTTSNGNANNDNGNNNNASGNSNNDGNDNSHEINDSILDHPSSCSTSHKQQQQHTSNHAVDAKDQMQSQSQLRLDSSSSSSSTSSLLSSSSSSSSSCFKSNSMMKPVDIDTNIDIDVTNNTPTPISISASLSIMSISMERERSDVCVSNINRLLDEQKRHVRTSCSDDNNDNATIGVDVDVDVDVVEVGSMASLSVIHSTPEKKIQTQTEGETKIKTKTESETVVEVVTVAVETTNDRDEKKDQSYMYGCDNDSASRGGGVGTGDIEKNMDRNRDRHDENVPPVLFTSPLSIHIFDAEICAHSSSNIPSRVDKTTYHPSSSPSPSRHVSNESSLSYESSILREREIGTNNIITCSSSSSSSSTSTNGTTSSSFESIMKSVIEYSNSSSTSNIDSSTSSNDDIIVQNITTTTTIITTSTSTTANKSEETNSHECDSSQYLSAMHVPYVETTPTAIPIATLTPVPLNTRMPSSYWHCFLSKQQQQHHQSRSMSMSVSVNAAMAMAMEMGVEESRAYIHHPPHPVIRSKLIRKRKRTRDCH